MDETGYIKLWRKFQNWEWYSDVNCKSVFLHCLIKANYKDKRWRGKNIQRGQFFTSVDVLAAELHLTPMQIRRALDKLENTGEIAKKGTNEGTYITVCKYEEYQPSGDEEEQTDNKRITNEEQTDNKRVTTTKNNKNNKNIKNDNPAGSPKLDFIDQILKAWQDVYELRRKTEYAITAKGKERSAASKLLGIFKKKFPDDNSEMILNRMREYFARCIDIKDSWLWTNMSLPIIISKFNEINTILKNGSNGRITSKAPDGTTAEDIARSQAEKLGITIIDQR